MVSTLIEKRQKCKNDQVVNLHTGRCIKPTDATIKRLQKKYPGWKVKPRSKIGGTQIEIRKALHKINKEKRRRKKEKRRKQKDKLVPAKAQRHKATKVVLDRLQKNIQRCDDNCDLLKGACNVETGRCIELNKQGIPKSQARLKKQWGNQYSFNDVLNIIAKADNMEEAKRIIYEGQPTQPSQPTELEIPLAKKVQPKRVSIQAGRKHRKRRCDDVEDYVVCDPDKLCSTASGRCIKDTKQNRKNREILRVGDRVIIGSAESINRLRDALQVAQSLQEEEEDILEIPPKEVVDLAPLSQQDFETHTPLDSAASVGQAIVEASSLGSLFSTLSSGPSLPMPSLSPGEPLEIVEKIVAPKKQRRRPPIPIQEDDEDEDEEEDILDVPLQELSPLRSPDLSPSISPHFLTPIGSVDKNLEKLLADSQATLPLSQSFQEPSQQDIEGLEEIIAQQPSQALEEEIIIPTQIQPVGLTQVQKDALTKEFEECIGALPQSKKKE